MSGQATPQVVLSFKFRYDGVMRHVDNVTFEGDRQQFIGQEIRRAGKFSNKTKRYSMVKVTDLTQINPIERVRP